MSFVKLHGSILDSSVWSLPHPTRIVWLTMLAMADEHGVVEAEQIARIGNSVVPQVAAAIVRANAPAARRATA